MNDEPMVRDQDEQVKIPGDVSVLPLRDTILFPHAILPLAVARETSVNLVNEAVRERKVIGVVTQRDPAIDTGLAGHALRNPDPARLVGHEVLRLRKEHLLELHQLLGRNERPSERAGDLLEDPLGPQP